MDNRAPPWSKEAEQCVLGCMIRSREAIGDVLQVLEPEHFHLEAHQKIFAAIGGIYDRGNPVDGATLAEELKSRQQVGEAGGYAYLGELITAAPTLAHLSAYVETVRQKSILRSLIYASQETLQECYDAGAQPDEVLERAERNIFAIAESGLTRATAELKEALAEVWPRLDAKAAGKMRGIPTGFAELNAKLAGLHDGEFTVIACRPGVGKTAFAACLARNLAFDRVPILLVSLEMARVELAERFLGIDADVSSHALRNGTVGNEEMGRMLRSADWMKQRHVYIADTPSQSMTRIAANARRLKRRAGLKVLIIDYLQLIEPESRREPRHEQVAHLTRRLKCLARELSIPVIVLAQLNREVESRTDRKPRLSDLRESGTVEQDSDNVILIHRPDMYDPLESPGLAEIIVAKQRAGPTGSVWMRFEKEYMRFSDIEVTTPTWSN